MGTNLVYRLKGGNYRALLRANARGQSSSTRRYWYTALYSPLTLSDGTTWGRYRSLRGWRRRTGVPDSFFSANTRLNVVWPSSNRTKQSLPSRQLAAGEKMTTSPSRYLGVMLSPWTLAANASGSARSGQPMYESATRGG